MKNRLTFALALSMLTSVFSAALVVHGCGGGNDDNSSSNNNDDQPEPERHHGLTEEEAAQTLAKVGDSTITVGEYADELASKGTFVRTRYNTPERRRQFLDKMIRFELLANEAQRRGYFDLEQVQRVRKQAMIRRFLQERYSEDREAIPAADVERYYREHPNEFHTPAQVRISHIQVADRATAQRVLDQIRASPNDAALFRTLAERHNTDPDTRDRYGDLRFVSRPSERRDTDPEVPAEVVEAAFQIQRIGQTFENVVRSEAGFHVVKLTGRRGALHRDLAQAERSIRARMARERREQGIEELVTRLRREANVQENYELIDQLRVQVPAGSSPTTDPRPPRPDQLRVPTKRGTSPP